MKLFELLPVSIDEVKIAFAKAGERFRYRVPERERERQREREAVGFIGFSVFNQQVRCPEQECDHCSVTGSLSSAPVA